MAVSGHWYADALVGALTGQYDLTAAASFKTALVANTYTPDPDTDANWTTDVSGNEVSGTGYTAGGQTVSGAAVSVVNDASATARANSTAYDVGDIVRPASANGYVYRCITAGTSAGTEPAGLSTLTTIGDTITDGTAVFENYGTSFVKFDFTDPSWASSTITARYAVIYETASGDLIGYIDFGQDESSSSGTFLITLPSDGLLHIGLG